LEGKSEKVVVNAVDSPDWKRRLANARDQYSKFDEERAEETNGLAKRYEGRVQKR